MKPGQIYKKLRPYPEIRKHVEAIQPLPELIKTQKLFSFDLIEVSKLGAPFAPWNSYLYYLWKFRRQSTTFLNKPATAEVHYSVLYHLAGENNKFSQKVDVTGDDCVEWVVSRIQRDTPSAIIDGVWERHRTQSATWGVVGSRHVIYLEE